MNILCFSWRDPKHPLAGGAEQVMHEHMKGWIEAGHKVTLFSSSFKGAKKETIDGVRIIRHGGQLLGVHVSAFFWYLFFKKEKYDLVVDQFHFIPFFTPLYIRVPKIAVIQEVAKDLWFRQPLPPVLRQIVGTLGYIIEPFIFTFYKKVPFITGSDSAKKDLLKMGIQARNIHVISHGVIIKKPRKMPSKEKIPTITFLGAITPDKGIFDVLEVFNILKDKGNYKFWIIGKGEGKYLQLLKRAEREFKGRLVYWGFVSNEEKFKLLAKSHILINPSVREGWGLVNIEANAMGTPVVAYKSPGLVDSVTKKTGVIVPENTPQALAQAISELLKQPEKLKALAKNAVLWSKLFSWEESRKKSLTLIEKIHAKKQSSTNLKKHTSSNPLQRFLIKRLQDAVAHEIIDLKPKSLVSVGCGEGFDLKHILSVYEPKKTVGVDLSKSALIYAKKQLPKVEFIQADATKLPFKDKEFDLVIALEILEHIPAYGKALDELKRIGKNNIIITVPWEPSFSIVSLLRGKYVKRLGRHPEHVNAWNKKSFAKAIAGHGFKIKKHKIIFPWQMLLVHK